MDSLNITIVEGNKDIQEMYLEYDNLEVQDFINKPLQKCRNK